MRRRKLGAGRSQIKDVDGGLSLRLDDGDFNVAFFARKNRTDAVKQPGLVLRNDLYERALGGARVIDHDPRIDFHFRWAPLFWTQPLAKHSLQINLPCQYAKDARLKPFPLWQIQFQRSKAVGKIKSIRHRAGLI